MQEVWKPVVGYANYFVSSTGKIKSISGVKERIIKTFINRGYETIRISRKGKAKTFKVHKLVAEAFIGERPKGFDICHCDGNKLNNSVYNLRYDTRSQNNIDASLHGRRKLSVDQVIEIRESTDTIKRLSEIYGVSWSLVQAVKTKKAWKHV